MNRQHSPNRLKFHKRSALCCEDHAWSPFLWGILEARQVVEMVVFSAVPMVKRRRGLQMLFGISMGNDG